MPTSQTPATHTLSSGVVMPLVGLGVFQSAPEDTGPAVRAALEAGYRLVDTAAIYGNEREVGRAIRESGIDREAVFVETKVWITDYGRAETVHAFEKATAKLGVDELDLLILHQPVPERFERTIEAYRALEDLLEGGRVHAIGVSNFLPHHLHDLLEATSVVPAVNQIELHPRFQQADVQAADAEHGILTQAWSPIGGVSRYRGDGSGTSVLEDPVVTGIAERVGRTPAQVLLRWHLQRGRAVVPKSVRRERIEENLGVFDFALADEDLVAIEGLESGVRGGPDPDSTPPERFGWTIPEA